jgi:ubiquinone/menaquinone biosynthesis C-methylase UbiE
MRTWIMLVCLSVGSLCETVTPAPAQEHPKGHSATELNQQFQDPDLDVGEFVERFEVDSREIYARRREIVEAIGLRPGMAVADIGSGTGLFAWLFAERVGPEGTVYAVEIAPAFLKYIGDQASRRGLEKVVRPVRSTQEVTNLAPGSIDVAFVCATYHHFERPEKILASIHRALRPGGRLIVIDFDLRKDSSAFVREHARTPKEVYFREIEAAGFASTGAKPPFVLQDSFFAVFRRIESGAQSSGRADER